MGGVTEGAAGSWDCSKSYIVETKTDIDTDRNGKVPGLPESAGQLVAPFMRIRSLVHRRNVLVSPL